MLKRFLETVNQASDQNPVRPKEKAGNLNVAERGNALIAKKRKARARSGCSCRLIAALCIGFASPSYSEEVPRHTAADLRMQAAQQALEDIRADNIELQRLIDYQTALIELAQNDRASARAARKPQQNCAERPLVRDLCQVLTTSFPPLSGANRGAAK